MDVEQTKHLPWTIVLDDVSTSKSSTARIDTSIMVAGTGVVKLWCCGETQIAATENGSPAAKVMRSQVSNEGIRLRLMKPNGGREAYPR